jgi:hypothetical protein
MCFKLLIDSCKTIPSPSKCQFFYIKIHFSAISDKHTTLCWAATGTVQSAAVLRRSVSCPTPSHVSVNRRSQVAHRRSGTQAERPAGGQPLRAQRTESRPSRFLLSPLSNFIIMMELEAGLTGQLSGPSESDRLCQAAASPSDAGQALPSDGPVARTAVPGNLGSPPAARGPGAAAAAASLPAE